MTTLPFDVPEHLSVQAFWDLFGRLETTMVEFKRGVSDEVKDAMVAFAMTNGGVIVHGVEDDPRAIRGCPLSQRTHDRITQAAHTCHLEVMLREVRVGSSGKKVTITEVPRVDGRIVTTPDGRLLRRVGATCVPVVGDALARFVAERTELPAEDRPTDSEGIDWDLSYLNRALRAAGRSTVTSRSVTRGLHDLGLLEQSDDPRPLLAAVLLFARKPTDVVRGASVQAVVRSGSSRTGPTLNRVELTGPIPLLMEQTVDFIESHTPAFEVVIGRRREVLPQYPTAAVREAVLNALAHRDYGLQGATIDVTIFEDRLEVRSPGPLPGHVTLDNMREEHYSRNRLIMRTLKSLGLVEEYGEGVDRMFLEMEARLMEPPTFEMAGASVSVTLRNRFIVPLEAQAWLSVLRNLDLTAAERRLLIVARQEDGVTPRRAREVLETSNARALLASAVAKGLLVRTGERGGSRYVLSNEIVLRTGATGVEAQTRKRQALLDELRRRGSLSTAEAAGFLHEDSSKARALLAELTATGLAEARGNTRARRYHAL